VCGVFGVCVAESFTRLMRSGEIEAARIGGKLWRTTRQNVARYAQRQFAAQRQLQTPNQWTVLSGIVGHLSLYKVVTSDSEVCYAQNT
jgi:hypothetical protein